MSTTYFAYSFPISDRLVEPHHRSLEDVTEILNREKPEPFLCCASRSNWVLIRIANLSSALTLPQLAGFRNTLFLVPNEEISFLLGEIDRVLAIAEAAPESLMEALEQWGADEIIEALRTSKEAGVPYLGPEVDGDGDDPKYLFAWLKSLRSVALVSASTGKGLLHVQPKWPGGVA
jgi:hypothetical protein